MYTKFQKLMGLKYLHFNTITLKHVVFLKSLNGIPLKQNYIEQSAFHQTLQIR